MVQLVWFKRDLRTADHRPLAEAAAAGPVLPLYVVEPEYWALPDTSRRQWEAQREALEELSARLAMLGAPLICRVGDVPSVLARIHRAIGITRLLAHEETGNAWTFARDRAVRRFCREAGIPCIEYPQFAVKRGLRDRDLWARHHAGFMAQPPVPEPTRLRPVPEAVPRPIPDAAALGLPPDGCARPQPGTRREALALLESFLAGRGAGYRRAMSRPAEGAAACSRLSVALATGALSVREAMWRLRAAREALAAIPPPARPLALGDVESLLSRLHWHCHFIQKLESEPALEARSLHPLHQAARHPTPPGDAALEAWASGRTGFPFLDACMRSLIATGWLNFRMRAMVQSFASYQLGLDWQASGTRLARLFTDYEPGIHWPQVQMQSGQTGINTPRIYNPVKQGLDQDPEGSFIRRWVPELARLPLPLLHTPWLADAGAQRAAGCVIGQDYPAPLVELAVATRAARERLSALRHQPGYRDAGLAVYQRHGSRARKPDEDNPPRQRAMAQARAAAATRQLSLGL